MHFALHSFSRGNDSCGGARYRRAYSTSSTLLQNGMYSCTRLYMKAEMYCPVHEIQMLVSFVLVDTLIAFHALTGCASVSQLSGHGKKIAWAVFKQHHTDLIDLGKGYLTETLLHQQINSSARYTACLRLIYATKHESS